jgi:hypothetical protein
MLFLCLVLLSDPSPDPPVPVPEITAGEYLMRHGTDKYDAVFYKNGCYKAVAENGTYYYGTWTWDRKTRCLQVHETVNGTHHYTWAAYLNEELCYGSVWLKRR